MAKGKGKTPTKKQLLSPKLDGMGFSNEEIMDGLIKHKLITDEDMKMMFSKKKPTPKPIGKKIRVQKPRMLASKGGTTMPMHGKKKTKMMSRGGAGMKKKTKMMSRGGAGMKKKTKMYSRGGAARRR